MAGLALLLLIELNGVEKGLLPDKLMGLNSPEVSCVVGCPAELLATV
jgi:hypothetical protein